MKGGKQQLRLVWPARAWGRAWASARGRETKASAGAGVGVNGKDRHQASGIRHQVSREVKLLPGGKNVTGDK